jgi:hypothetical protein
MTLLAQIKEIEEDFLFYGFIYQPLERKRIASLLNRGFNYRDIYNFGCDAYCGA